MASFSFDATIQKLRDTHRGKEASMYGPIRDLFIHVLGYPAADVDIDTAGEGGRPDVTARAPSGLHDGKGKQVKIDWIVVEAKDERGCFLNTRSREEIFSKKSKYIGTNTAWFVMVEPEAIIARQVTGNDFAVTNDIEVRLDGLTKHDFVQRLELLRHSAAGVPNQLKRFRGGDTRLIACEKLTKPDPATSSQRELNRYRVTRKRFFDSVREVTAHLQNATRNTLEKVRPEIERYRAMADEFGERYKERERDKGNILNLPIPVAEAERDAWERVIGEHHETRLEAEMAARLNELDQLVGAALGLDAADIAFIQHELRTDPFLKGIRPRYPGTVTRKQGFRTGLDSSSRYQ